MTYGLRRLRRNGFLTRIERTNQFLGSTWRAGTPPMTVPAVGPPTTSNAQGYATDGDGDGLADVWNPADAIAAAARLLAANGAPADYRQALYAYNPDPAYVDEVLAQANQYRGAFAPGASGDTRAALAWAVAHVGRFTYNLGPPTDRGGSVQDMQSREPAGTTCDCSMYVRWGARSGRDRRRPHHLQPADGKRPPSERRYAR
jgi:hypothetical protein